ncbi:MAG: DUF460 domain-containing protein [Candidatus Altiarchaeota archaeon]
MNKYLIVGVDPGTTTGVALIDLKGNLVSVTSSRDMGLSGVIEHIVSHGVPSMMACDVNPAPGMVSKLASSMGVATYVPDKPLSVSEKIGLTRGLDTSDAHQRDSLAAALNAFIKNKNLFKKIESKGLGDDVKHIVLQGYSIEYAARILSEPEPAVDEGEDRKKSVRELSPGEKRIRSLEKRVRNLSIELGVKDADIVRLHEEIAGLKARNHVKQGLRDTSSENTIRNLEIRVGSLKNQIRLEKSVRRMLLDAVKGGKQLVGVYPEVIGGYTIIRKKIRASDIEQDKVRRVFTDVNANHETLRERGIPVHGTDKLKQVDGIWFMDKTSLDEMRNEISVEGLIHEYRNRKKR